MRCQANGPKVVAVVLWWASGSMVSFSHSSGNVLP